MDAHRVGDFCARCVLMGSLHCAFLPACKRTVVCCDWLGIRRACENVWAVVAGCENDAFLEMQIMTGLTVVIVQSLLALIE